MSTDRPMIGLSDITEAELLALAAGIVQSAPDEIDRACVIVGTRDGGIGLVGSGLVQSAPMMVLLLAAALERVAVQALADHAAGGAS